MWIGLSAALNNMKCKLYSEVKLNEQNANGSVKMWLCECECKWNSRWVKIDGLYETNVWYNV